MPSSSPRGLSPRLQAPRLLLPHRQGRRPAGGHRLSEHSPAFAEGAWCMSNVPSAENRRREEGLITLYRFHSFVYLRQMENI